MTVVDEITKLEEEIEQRKAKIKSIKEDGRSEMLSTIADAREEYREAATKLNDLIAEYQKMYPAYLSLTYPDLLRGTKFRL